LDFSYGQGLFQISYYEAHEDGSLGDFHACVPYDEYEKEVYELDGPWKAGQAFGVLTIIFETVALAIVLLVMLFLNQGKRVLWRVLQGLLAASIFTQFFMFGAFASNVCKDDEDGSKTTCKPGVSGAFAVLNIILLIALEVMACLVPPPSNPVFRRWDATNDNLHEARKQREIPEEEVTESSRERMASERMASDRSFEKATKYSRENRDSEVPYKKETKYLRGNTDKEVPYEKETKYSRENRDNEVPYEKATRSSREEKNARKKQTRKN